MIYRLLYTEVVVKKHIPALSHPVKERIKAVVEEKLTRDPLRVGKPLLHSLRGHFRLRIGDDRIVYRIEDAHVIVVAIKHRRDVYDT